MKKFLLAGASTLALLGFASTANAQALDVDVSVDLSETTQRVLDSTRDFGGFYINSAINDAEVDGSVSIDTDGLLQIDADVLDGALSAGIALNASRINLDVDASTAASLAVTPAAGLALGAAAGIDVGLDIIGTSIASTGELATTAIGAVNTGVTSLAALSTRDYSDDSTNDSTGANIDFTSSAADSASNTSNTAARAAAAATALLIDGATSSIAADINDNTASGPAAIVAANLAVNNAIVDGSVAINDATTVAIAGTATTAIGAVNTGTITNGLPGRIDIVAGDTSSTTTTNTNVGGGTD